MSTLPASSGVWEGSYLRLIDFLFHSTLLWGWLCELVIVVEPASPTQQERPQPKPCNPFSVDLKRWGEGVGARVVHERDCGIAARDRACRPFRRVLVCGVWGVSSLAKGLRCETRIDIVCENGFSEEDISPQHARACISLQWT